MKLLITGATGLIGQQLVDKLFKEGHQIHYLTTRVSQIHAIPNAFGFLWNPKKGTIDPNCFKDVTCIIHLAGATVSKRWTAIYKKEILDSRVQSTQTLLAGLRKQKGTHLIRSIVSASAIGIYPSDLSKIMTETIQVSPQTFMQKVVAQWEKEVDEFQSEGLSICKLRIGLVLTKKGGVLGTLKIPTYFGLGAAFDSGRQGQSWIHIDDLTAVFLKAAKDNWEGVYNAVAPNPVTQTVFMKALARAMNRPYFLPPIPAFLLKMGAGEMSDLVLDSHWVSCQKISNQGVQFRYTDIEKAIVSLLD